LHTNLICEAKIRVDAERRKHAERLPPLLFQGAVQNSVAVLCGEKKQGHYKKTVAHLINRGFGGNDY